MISTSSRRNALRSGALAASIAVFLMSSSCQKQDQAILPFGSLDSPPNGAVLSKVASVAGWALAEDGVQSVSVYLDRRYIQAATLGIARQDVKTAFPQFPEAANSGWQSSLNLSGIASGPHLIQVAIRTKAGAVTTFQSSVFVK
jgi:hypothetical protein